LRTLACREEKAVTQAQGKPDGPARGDEKAEQKAKQPGKKDKKEEKDEKTEQQDKKDVPIWLQVIAGVIAILAFLGIANFHQLGTAIGWQKTHTTSPRPSPSPPVSPIAQDTGPVDPQDAGTCTSALSDIQTLQSEVPTYSYAGEAQFYRDESATFSSLSKGATDLALKQDLLYIQLAMLALAEDYMYYAHNDPADAPQELSELNGYESETESFCSQNAGITG
jgi:hypothetical protein